jgi:hypothetical protein
MHPQQTVEQSRTSARATSRTQLRWTKLVVNSERKERCLCLREEKGVMDLEMAETKGFWSVKRVKRRHSRRKRKWRTERKAARNSLSKVE